MRAFGNSLVWDLGWCMMTCAMRGVKKLWGYLGQFYLWGWRLWWQNEIAGSAAFKASPFPKGSLSRNHSISKPLELIHIDIFVCLRARHLNPWSFIGGNGLFNLLFFPITYHTVTEKNLNNLKISLLDLFWSKKTFWDLFTTKSVLCEIKKSKTSPLSPAEALAIQDT